MKISRVLLTTVCVVACLSLAALVLAQQPTTAPAQKPATPPATEKAMTPAEKPATAMPAAKTAAAPATAKGAAPVHHTSMTSIVTATVVSVDPQTRKVTLKGEEGEYSFVAGPNVKNLAKVKAGDVVTVTYTESVGYVVKKEGTMGAATSTATTSAAEGEKPAGVTTSKTTVTVMITAIDPKVPSVTFKGPSGGTHTVKVQDPEKLEGVKVGDMVDITYTEALSVAVHAPKKAATTAPAKK